MAILTPLITAKKLRQKLSRATYLAIWDDDNTGDIAVVDASEDVLLCLDEAHALVVSFLGDLYTKIPDGTDSELPKLLVHAELMYAVSISYDRHAEYTRQYGDNPRKESAYRQASVIMKNIQEAVQRIVDVPPAPAPANVGGVTRDDGQRVVIGRDSSGCLLSGDF